MGSAAASTRSSNLTSTRSTTNHDLGYTQWLQDLDSTAVSCSSHNAALAQSGAVMQAGQ